MNTYDETRFRQNLDAALHRIRTILDNTRNPCQPADVPHRYDDKYLLVEFLGRTATAAILQCLGGIGLTPEGLAQLTAWARTHAVTLRFRARETCTFVREETHEVESESRRVIEKSSRWGTSENSERVLTTVREYLWHFDFSWELLAFSGPSSEQAIVLQSHSGRVEMKTAAQSPPRPDRVVHPDIDANITLLLGLVDAQQRAIFAIDRASSACRTPRRNPQVESLLWAFQELSTWCWNVHGYLSSELFSAFPDHNRDLSVIHAQGVFVPVVPVFEATRTPNGNDDPIIPMAYASTFLAEQRRSLTERSAQLAQVFPRDASPISVSEAVLLMILSHMVDVCLHFSDGVDHVERLLYDQLTAAIGRVLTPADFAAYMDFHHRKLFKPAYRPQPFSHAVRRPNHTPEGVVGIEVEYTPGTAEPVSTIVSRDEAQHPMGFSLDAATRVHFLGDRYLHAWVSHHFASGPSPTAYLVARARQFSSFILLVGRIASADTFEPKAAIILQNQDVLKIPLLLEAIPTPKEFRDAIESLSPEQQRFAQAVRAMQLQSTLFGVCVVQIKPQLEALLSLPPDCLTKEIRLTQDLLTLFIEYQIPSDLLSYDGPPDAPPEHKVARVTEHVRKLLDLIAQAKRREVEDALEGEALRLAESNRTRAQAARAATAPAGAPAPPRPPPPMAAAPAAMAPSPSPPFASVAPPPTGAVAPSPAAASVWFEATPAPHAVSPPPPPAPEAARPPAAPPSTNPAAGPSPAGTPSDLVDYTRIPAELDRRFEAIDEDNALRPAILHLGAVWTRTSRQGLLVAPSTHSLHAKDQKTEHNRAFDLLDALTKSGAIPLTHASLHVVVAAAHRFDKTLIETVIEDNVNPIEKVERSVMIAATTVHRRPASELLSDEQRTRFFTHSPRLALPDTDPTR
jgi:hypothetical protein